MRPYAPRHAARAPQAPTQVAFPWKAVARTVVQTFGAVASVLWVAAEVLQVLGEDLGQILPDGWGGWLLAASATAGVVAGALARVMALSRVNDLLTRIGLGAEPRQD